MEDSEKQGMLNDCIHPDKDSDCGITEAYFPCIGKCCSDSDAAAGAVCENICADCDIWISLPDGASLSVTTIFNCHRFGYGKRIKK